MKIRICLFLVLFAYASVAFSATDDDGYNEVTIRPSDIPADAPRFEDFPAEPYSGKNAAPKLKSDAKARMYRTRLAEWAKEPPNFAGHYILATWGCGASCTQITIIDAKTGKVFFPNGARYNAAVNVHADLLGDGDLSDLWHGSGAVKFRQDSRLLVLIGMPEEKVEKRGISYYVWEHDRLRLIRFVHKAWYPDDE